ncbi:MAG TPA: hypothetical protein VN086_03140 [Candidatus Paceibacterota bacterium]|nr:hypothetical protein [Candidatus Paceibacterota bacterium]
MTSPNYSISSAALVLRDSPQRIDYHIRTGDYFSVLATIVGFIEDSLASQNGMTAEQKALAHELRTDLRYVQANYTIVPRKLEDIEVIRPSGNLLEKRA